jgi:hypothetical protein
MSIFNSFGDRGVSFGKNLFPSAPFGATIFPDTFAINFINAVGITDGIQQNAIIRLVYDLKTFGLWDKMKAVYPFVGGTASTHKFNLINPVDTNSAFRLVFTGGWVHSQNGALPNAVNSWADTFLITSTNLSVNSSHLSMYSRTQSTTGFHDIGNSSSGNFALSAYYSGIGKLIVSYLYPTHSFLNTETNTLGLIIGSRTANNVLRMFFNGGLLGTNTTVRTSNLPAISLYLGATNSSGVAGFFSNRQFAFASIGDGLTDSDAINLNSAVQTFNTILGRQV